MNSLTLVKVFFLVMTVPSVKSNVIELNTDNVLTIRGTIKEDNVNRFIYELNKMDNKQDIYVYLDTNGGSVSAGTKIVNEVEKYNMSCIAQRAYSMGFVILQSCAKRYITPYATVMQHQISYGMANEKAKVESYVGFVDQIGHQLEKMQASKIGMCPKSFKEKTYNDWWLSGTNIIEENVADEVVDVTCTKELTTSNYTVTTMFGDDVYSNCPLISHPVGNQAMMKDSDMFEVKLTDRNKKGAIDNLRAEMDQVLSHIPRLYNLLKVVLDSN